MNSFKFPVLLLGFWCLTLVVSPIVQLIGNSDKMAVTLNMGDEEPAESLKVDPLEKDIIALGDLPFLHWEAALRSQLPAHPDDLSPMPDRDILLPPPERTS